MQTSIEGPAWQMFGNTAVVFLARLFQVYNSLPISLSQRWQQLSQLSQIDNYSVSAQVVKKEAQWNGNVWNLYINLDERNGNFDPELLLTKCHDLKIFLKSDLKEDCISWTHWLFDVDHLTMKGLDLLPLLLQYFMWSGHMLVLILKWRLQLWV